MDNYWGLVLALVIITLWILTISIYQIIDLTQLNYLGILLSILWLTFLNTGLFITAHDGMHGLIYPDNIKVNHFIGSVCLILYAGLSYDNLKEKHFLHHRFSGTNLDPDFHNSHNITFLSWYVEFMTKYLTPKHLLRLSVLVLLIAYLCKISWLHLLLFWALPLILSSLQLFFFGTFLPHKEENQSQDNTSSIKSLYLPLFLSLISCYHFSYHQEHHQYPFIPWWKIPFFKIST